MAPLKHLNIWLASSYVTGFYFYRNLPCTISGQPKEIVLLIVDRQTPESMQAFNRGGDVAIDFLKRGKSVAVSCYGGHGRTGLMLACIAARLCPNLDDPIDFIRKQGCQKWVESEDQAEFIFKLARKPMPKKYKDTPRALPNFYQGGMYGYGAWIGE